MFNRIVMLTFLVLFTATNAWAENYCGGNLLDTLRSMRPYLINETAYRGFLTNAQCALNEDWLLQGKHLLVEQYHENAEIEAADFDLLLRLMEKERKLTYQTYFEDDCIPFTNHLINPDTGLRELILYFNSKGLPRPIMAVAGYEGVRAVISLKTDQKILVEKTVAYFNHLSDRDTDLGKLKELSADLYEIYLKPVEHYLQSGLFQHLTIVQDTASQLIPFESLYDAENHEYVMQKPYSISYRPNLTHHASRHSLGVRRTAVIAYPSDDGLNQDNHQREADAIAALAPGSVHLSGARFSTAGLLNRLNHSSHSILHISSHAEFKSPFEQSMIRLDGGKAMRVADLEKTIRSAAARSAPLDLLILSACQTARSHQADTPVNREQMIRASLGLAGAAARSGAKSVIASLWNVIEADRVLIDTGTMSTSIQGRDFHSLIQKNLDLTKAAALQQAKRNLMQDEYIRHRPHLWSVYILIGEPGK